VIEIGGVAMSDERFDHGGGGEPPAADPAPAARRRPARKWLLLAAVWSIGLLVWGLYLVAILYLLSRVL
jgi:hypothetical protein